MTNPAAEFMDALWTGKPNEAGIQVWQKTNKKTSTFASATEAAKYAVNAASRNDNDVYVAAGLASKITSAPQRNRTTAAGVVGIPGIWADIDVNGGPEAKTGAAPDIDTAMALAETILVPTLVVNSGYGIQAWWLFEEGPWIFGSPDERQQAARLVAAFQTGMRLRAKQQGWTIDSTHDLARLMRVPGTYNYKGTDIGFERAPVELVDSDGPRHSIVTVGAVVQEHMGAALETIKRVTGEAVNIELRGTQSMPPMLKIDEMCQANPDFRIVWEHRNSTKTRNWSMSEFEMSIANYCVRAGFDDQELADTLVYHRLRYGDPKGKADRVDYISQVIGKARQAVEDEDDDEELELERNDAVDQLASMAKSGQADPTRATGLFSRIVGGAEVKELIQDGRDPDTARFRLVLADGREVPIGDAGTLIDYGRFRQRYMVVTGKLPPRIKTDKWDRVVQAMLDCATVNEAPEDSRASQAVAWIDSYIDQGLSTDRDQACAVRDPFEENGEVFIFLDTFAHWLKRIRQERMPMADLKQLLTAAGFERRTVNYNNNDKKTTRSYWVIGKDVIQGHG